jgi:hypothetical protein
MSGKTLQNLVYLWTPWNVPIGSATASISFKPPELNDSNQHARNQTQARLRNGTMIVYDRGVNYNNTITMQFKDVPDVQRCNLVSFFDAVQWGSTKLAYVDQYGCQRTVRLASPKISYADTGLRNRNASSSEVLWNFNFNFTDISDSSDELSQGDPPVSSALTLHILDYNDPHDPEVSVDMTIAGSPFVVEKWPTLQWKSVIWKMLVSKDVRSFTQLMCGQHNGNGPTLTNATVVDAPFSQMLVNDGNLATKVTFTTDLWTDTTVVPNVQYMRLKATTTEDGVNLVVRRSKMAIGS